MGKIGGQYSPQFADEMDFQKKKAAAEAYANLSLEEKILFDKEKAKEQEAEVAKKAAKKAEAEAELIKWQGDRLNAKEKEKQENIKKVDPIDKKVVERYMSKNYEKVKDITALKPGQVYYIIKKEKENDGIRKPFRYECKKNAQECKSEICLNKPEEEDCVLWKKTTWGSLTGESAEKYKPYTLDQYIKYMDFKLIDDNGNHDRDNRYFNGRVEIKNGRVIEYRGGKTKSKSKSKSKSKRKQSRRKGSKKRKTRRHYKK